MRDAGTTRQLADSFDPRTLRPHPERLVARVITPDQVTEGGLIIPDIATGTFRSEPAPSMRRWCGEVVAVGSSPEWDGVEVGDVVVWGKYTNAEFVHRNTTFVVLDVSQVEAVVDQSVSKQRQDKDVRGSWDPDVD